MRRESEVRAESKRNLYKGLIGFWITVSIIILLYCAVMTRVDLSIIIREMLMHRETLLRAREVLNETDSSLVFWNSI
jgi:hypothetical protein